MGRNFKAANIRLCLILSVCAWVCCGQGNGQDVKDIESPAKDKRVAVWGERIFRGNENHFHLPPSPSQEEIEVVDEDNTQRFDTTPAEPVPDSLVEVFIENGHNILKDDQAKRDRALRPKHLLENKTSSLSTAKLRENTVQTLQTVSYKTNQKTKQKYTKVYPSRLEKLPRDSKIFPRVSIPGHHRTPNTSHTRFNWMSLLSPRQITLLENSSYGEHLSKITDGVGQRANQKNRKYLSSRDDFSTFIARMGLGSTPKLDHVSPRGQAHSLPSENTHWSSQNAHLSPIQSVLNRGESSLVLKGKPISVPDSSNLLNVSKGAHTVRPYVPFKKKEDAIQMEPEVFDSFKNVKFKSIENKHLISHDQRENNGVLISSTANRKIHFSGSKVVSHDNRVLPKSVHWRQENTHLSTKKVFAQSISNRQPSTKVIKGKPQSVPDLTKSFNASKVVQRANLSSKKKENTIKIGPKASDTVKNVKPNKNEYWISNGRHESNRSLISFKSHWKTDISDSKVLSHSDARQQSMKSAHLQISKTPDSSDRKDIALSNMTQAENVKSQLKVDKYLNKTSRHLKSGQFPNKIKQALLKNNATETLVKVPQLPSSNTDDEGKVAGIKERHGNQSVSTTITTNDKVRNGLRNKENQSLYVDYINKTSTELKKNNSATTKSKCNVALNSTIARHLKDLISFFSSFSYPSNSTDDDLRQSNQDIYKNRTITNDASNKSADHILKNMQKLLDLINFNRPNVDNCLQLESKHTVSSTSSFTLSQRERKRLQVSIYRGWNKASKRKGLHLRAGILSNWPVKNESSLLNYTMDLRTGSSLSKSRKDAFEHHLLQLMKNVSRKDLENLENAILKALSSNRLRNFRRQPQKPNQQHQTRLTKQNNKRQQSLNRSNDNPKHIGKEHLKHQLHNHTVKLAMFPYRKPTAEQHQKQNQTQRHKNVTYHEQIDNRTTLRRYQQPQVGQAHHTNRTMALNMSYTVNSTGKQNCTLASSADSYINYRCRQTKSNSSNLKNRIKDFFHEYLTASHVNSRTFKGKKTTAKNNLHLNSSHNHSGSLMSLSPLAHNSLSSRKQVRNTTSQHRVGNSSITNKATKAGANLPKVQHVDDIKNVSIQHEEDVFQEINVKTNSLARKLGPEVVEVTEFVDQAPDKGNLLTKWSEWSPCSVSCGSHGKRKRIQFRCRSSLQELRDCTVSGEQRETCAQKPCPVDGKFTLWSHWSPCSRSCGFRGVSVRTRSCTPPSHGGKPCYGVGIKTRTCYRKHCPVNGGLSQWSQFGPCSKSCGGGVRMRHRHCNNPVPRFGGKECDLRDMFETQSCSNMKCPVKILKRPQVANVDPKTFCGFNPCEEVGCLHDPAARCITDFECNPVFFNTDGKMLSKCKGMKNLYSRIPDLICSFNPCLSEHCLEIRDQCVVDLKCRPVFIGIDTRLIPPRCQVHGTVRVDRIKEDQSWNKQAPVKLASEVMPSFTQLWFPVPPPLMQPVLRVPNVNTEPLAFSRVWNTYPKATVHRPEVHLEIEKPKSGPAYKNDDDDEDEDEVNGENDNEDDNDDVGYVHDDIDDDDFK